MTFDEERAHDIMLERACQEHAKRIKDKQKRFGKHTDNEQDMIERTLVALLNRNELINLMGQYQILIPIRELPFWRPTERHSGDIDGVHEAVTIIATNGLLGWFLTFEGEAWCGHIQFFSGEVKPLFKFSSGSGKTAKPRTRQKSKRQMILDSL